jgi:Leucine-rich repeat (LRR) protein
MNVIMDQIDELKQMQNFPRFYLSNYFDELKNQIDLKYALKQDEQVKYLEIIKNIESFEQEAYKKCKSFNTFDKEIKSIEDKLNDLNLNEITQLIDELKYKIEKEIFLNKSIFFYEEYSLLIILNDIYIRKKSIDYESLKILTRQKLIACILKDLIIQKINNKNSTNEIIKFRWDKTFNYLYNLKKIPPSLFLGLANLEIIDFWWNQIEIIHENTFNGLTNLKKINFYINQVKEINPNAFNGLANLEIIDFRGNQIEVIHENTFNGLSNLKQISFYYNQIKEIPPNLFNGLAYLEIIDFSSNRIEIIHENTFNGLTNLKEIDFSVNHIKEMHLNLFNGLANLEIIQFSKNKIEAIHENTFNGLTSLKEIDFSHNQIKEIHPNAFKELANLEIIKFRYNKIEIIHENTFNGLTSLKEIDFRENQVNSTKIKLYLWGYKLLTRIFKKYRIYV